MASLNAGLIAIILSVLLYAVFVLLPMVPAIKIYRLFPDTKVGLSGPLQGMTVKATGAFAAYVVTALLGFFLIRHTQRLIDDYVSQRQSWELVSEVQFVDASGQPIAASDDPSQAPEVTIIPDPNVTTGRLVKLFLPAYDEDTIIQLSKDGFVSGHKRLAEAQHTDAGDNRIELGPITLRQINQPYPYSFPGTSPLDANTFHPDADVAQPDTAPFLPPDTTDEGPPPDPEVVGASGTGPTADTTTVALASQ